MKILKTTKVSFVLFVFLCIFFLGSTNAFASTKSQPLDHNPPRKIGCHEGYVYDNLSRQNNALAQVGPTYRNYNGTSSPATVTFTSSQSGTIGVTTSVGGSVDANVIVTGVSVTFGVSVSVSLTATTGTSISITVPAHQAGYGQFGVWRVVTTGHYYYRLPDCSIGYDYGTVTAYSPSYIGWNTYTGN